MKNIYQAKSGFIQSALIALFLFFCLEPAKATDFYWVGGSGSWSDYPAHWATTSGGIIFHTAIPTLNDDVYFDANSFTSTGSQLLIDNTLIYCKSMNWTGVVNTPSVNGLGNTLNIYGSLTLVPGMNWSVKRINFLSTFSGNTITSAGQLMDTLYFNGSGAYGILDGLTSKSVYIYDGSFASNNNNMQQQKFVAGIIGSTVNVDLGTSTITCNDVFNSYYGTVNLTASSANLIFNNAINQKIYLWSNGHTFNDITANSRVEVIGSFNCQHLVATNLFYINSAGISSTAAVADFSASITLDANFTVDTMRILTTGVDIKIRQLHINNEFTANGICGAPIQLMPIDFQPSAIITKSSGQVTIDYVILTAINASGGALFTANNSIDGGNNTGWILNNSLPRTLYWVGGTGYWSDENKWAVSSGGPGGNCIPSSNDDVIFDASSFLQTGDSVIISGVQAICKNMDWTNASSNPVFYADYLNSVKLYGSLTLSPAMVFNVSGLTFAGTLTGNTITTAGQYIPSILIGATGSWTLTDELNCQGIQVYEGTFNTANNDVHADYFSANGISSNINIDFGTSTLYIAGNYVAFNSGMTINSANANLIFYNATGNLIYGQLFTGFFNDVTVQSGTYFSGKLTCNNFLGQSGLYMENMNAVNAVFDQSFSSRTMQIGTMTLNAGVNSFAFDTLTITNSLISSNTCNSTLSIYPYTSAQAQLYQSAGTLIFNYTYIKNIGVSGGATFIADNSFDLGNNSGFNFNTPAPRDLYWVGGTGDWTDNAHWSLASGGSGGNCQPGQTDNVMFDSNSFPQANDSIRVSPGLNVYCNNLIFSGVPANTLLISNSSAPIFINGSITLEPNVNLWDITFEMTTPNIGQTITSAGNFIGRLVISGSGTVSMLDPVNLGNFVHRNGTFNTNDFNFNSGDINMGGPAILNFGYSTVTLLAFYATSGTVIGGNANLIMTSSFQGLEVINANFNTITFNGTAHTNYNFSCNRLYAMGSFTDINSQITAGYSEFHDVVTLANQFTGDSLVLDNPGKLVLINQLNINDAIVANGNSGFPIQIEGYNGSGTITKATGSICMNYVLLKNMNGTGGAQFFAGFNSVDLGGNTGWSFTSCIPPLTDVWPGDANYDLVADNNDILNIGLAYGYTGPVRTSASLAWVAQPATDWTSQFANGANLKHADTDGNGTVNSDDTTAVALNYGLTHLRLQAPVPSQFPTPVLYLVSNPDTASLSDTIDVSIFLGTNSTPVDSIYGIAFTVNFDPALIDTSYLTVDYTGCWMGTQQVDLLTFNKNLISQGSVDLAIVRTDQQNINGFGFLGRLGIVIVDNVGAKVTMPVTITDVYAITSHEYLVPVTNQNDSIVIDTTVTTGINFIDLNNSISLYPNPATDIVTVNAGGIEISNIEIYNQFGLLISKAQPESSRFRINTAALSQGLYVIKLITREGLVTKKFEVIRK